MIEPLTWDEKETSVRLLDQSRLPGEEVWLNITSVYEMAEAIRSLRVRGAPAIGIAAAFGVVLSLRDLESNLDPYASVIRAIEDLGATRPTAVNLFWALNRVRREADRLRHAPAKVLRDSLLAEAHAIYDDDRQSGMRLAEYGLSLLREGMTVLTHCHTGGLATSGYGTALAPLLISKTRGVHLQAFVDETRPLLQGSRITAWELTRAGIPATLITDSMAGYVMAQGKVDAIFVGADRITANGDVANKIGTYSLAVLAHAHEIPFYVSAPWSTIDLQTPSGSAITIEERDAKEITNGFGRQTAPEGVPVYNPAFDVTPARYITAIVTDRGIIYPPYETNLAQLKKAEGRIV